jgi:hypothetical protein
MLDRMEVTPGPSDLTDEHWNAYHASIVEPNQRPNRPFGAYATAARKGRHQAGSDRAGGQCPMRAVGKAGERAPVEQADMA